MRSSRLLTVLLAGTGALTMLVDACAPKAPKEEPAQASADAAVVATGASLASDAGAATSAVDAGRGNLVTVGAASFAVSVIDRPAWPESGTGSKRLGYVRAGSTFQIWDKPLVNDDCKDGWLAVATGGWVCGKLVTPDLQSPRVRLAPKPADRDAGMPYRYGVNLGDGTPLYRRVLGEDDRKKFESAAKSKSDKDKDKPERAEKVGREEASAGREGASAETASLVASTTPTESDDRGPAVTGEDEPTPTNAREKDAGAPVKPRLKDLRGRGVLVRKMARGFYLALDRDFKAAGTRWWRTTYGFATPFDKIMLQTSVTKHHGAWFADTPFAEALEGSEADAGESTSTIGAVGFVTYTGAHQILPNEEKTKIGWGPELPKRGAVLLTGRTYKVDGMTFHEAAGGFWVRLSDLKLAKPAPPADLAPNEKWIDVDLTRQALVAFEGTRPVFATLISSGRRNLVDKEHDFPTPTGTYWIREKHVTTTMDGDVAADGAYSIEDVPWVMYFQGSYALHGAFWHDAFGNMRSHGCVNMAPEDARTLFQWADPPLPEGWHGVFAKDEHAGTRVVVHEDQPPKRHRRTPAAASE